MLRRRLEAIVLVELLCAVMQGVDQQRADTDVLRDAHCATDGVLQQSGSKLDALGTMVNGQAGENQHWNGIGHVASHAAGCRLVCSGSASTKATSHQCK